MLVAGFAFGETRVAKLETEAKFPESLPRLETVDGKVYENLQDIKVTVSRVSFRHESGLASVLLVKLPEDMQKVFGYDVAVAADALAAERAAKARYLTAAAAVESDKATKKAAAKKRLDFIGSAGYEAGGGAYRIRVDSRTVFALMEAGYSENEAREKVEERKK